MERGLIWLPLLAIFIGLAWAGWREYQKVEAYRLWAEHFDRAKYDIKTVLGQKDDRITWGKPAHPHPQVLDSFSLKEVNAIELLVNGEAVSVDNPPRRGNPSLNFIFENAKSVQIPFTDVSLAAQWTQKLQELRAKEV